MRRTFEVLTLVLVCAAIQAHAEPIVAVSLGGRTLVTFDSTMPGTITSTVTVTGIGTASIEAIDYRPADGQLYGYSRVSNSIYRLDAATGTATLVSTLNNSSFSLDTIAIDFNPVTGQLRLVGFDAPRQIVRNLRVDVDTGATVEEGNARFAPSDTNAGRLPFVTGAAYTNNFAGATATTLYVVSNGPLSLSIQDPPSSGMLTTVGPTIIPGVLIGFDISGLTGIAYATANFPIEGISTIPQFYTINLGTGVGTLVGRIGTGAGLPSQYVGVAAPVGRAEPIPEPATVVLLLTGLAGVGAIGRRRKAAGEAKR
jgi:hypothetical protein